jgi:hypothetical protein
MKTTNANFSEKKLDCRGRAVQVFFLLGYFLALVGA